MKKQPLGRRLTAWLQEAPGETFRDGKWRFWFITVAGLQLLNAVLTTLIFHSTGNLQNYMGAILLGAGALVGWIAVGCLHYSDGHDRQLSRWVSALDSATLLFVVAHFAFLMWAYGHLKTLQSAEAKYEAAAVAYNERAEKIQADNARIAEAIQKAAEADKARATIENDTVYQQRKAAEAGALIPRRRDRTSSAAASLSTSPIQLEKPAPPPEQSSAHFLTDWDAWIRVANFGELLLAVITLIVIRNQTAKTNAGAGGEIVRAPTYLVGSQQVEGFGRGADPSQHQAVVISDRQFRILPDGRREVVYSRYAPEEVGQVWPAEEETNPRP
jgi:hypothetical protein